MNTIYISEYLKRTDRGRPIVEKLEEFVSQKYFQLKEIPFNKNEWCRDYMPVINANNQPVLFSYNPPYLENSIKGKASIPEQEKVCNQLGIKFIDKRKIKLDGGAIEIYEDKGIISERFIQLNNHLPNVLQVIKDALALDELITVPADPWDFTGHVDGLVRFVDKDTILINDYEPFESLPKNETKHIKSKYNKWKETFHGALKDAGFKIEILASGFHLNKKASSAKGIYLNFLILNNCILMPVFSDLTEENLKARNKLKELYKKEILEIQCDKLSEYGGVINCITWSENLSGQ